MTVATSRRYPLDRTADGGQTPFNTTRDASAGLAGQLHLMRLLPRAQTVGSPAGRQPHSL
jgi:hypothetical protein